MRELYLIVSLMVAMVLFNLATESRTKACSDYYLLGRTYEKCITDKRVRE